MCWRPNGRRYEEPFFQATTLSGRVTCSVFEWISATGPGELIEITPHTGTYLQGWTNGTEPPPEEK